MRGKDGERLVWLSGELHWLLDAAIPVAGRCRPLVESDSGLDLHFYCNEFS